MQRKWIVTITAGLAAVLVAGGLAQANMGGMGGMGGGWGRHFGMMGGGMGLRALLERYDANHDGKITQDEITKNRADWLAEFDTNKDGTLSLDEFKNLWMKANQERMVREFQFFDTDGNAQVTLQEYEAPLAQIVADRDRNGDGALSRDDMRGPGGPGHHWKHGMGQGGGAGDGGAGDGGDGDSQ